MGDKSRIEWTDATWNPVGGCTKVSPGCKHCYAEALFDRFRGRPGFELPFDNVTLRPAKLDQPERWRRPRKIFVNSVSDLFHEDVPADFIRKACEVMAGADRHTYQVLTKRHERMERLLCGPLAEYAALRHIWWGVSVEDAKHGQPRIIALRDTPAAVKWASVEPLLEHPGPGIHVAGLDWVVVGGESGPGFRPMEAEWVRSMKMQCEHLRIPFFFKQWSGLRPGGPALLDGREYREFPR